MHYGLVLFFQVLAFNAQTVRNSPQIEFERTVGTAWNPKIELGDDIDLTDDDAYSHSVGHSVDFNNDWEAYADLEDNSETAVRETRTAEARIAQLVPSTLHPVDDCESCGKDKQFFCGKDRWAINKRNIDEGFTLGTSLKVWGCKNLPKKPTIVRDKSNGKIYVVEPHIIHETGGCKPCGGKVGNVCDKEKWVANLPHVELGYIVGPKAESWGCKHVHNELLIVRNSKTKKVYFIESTTDPEPEPQKKKVEVPDELPPEESRPEKYIRVISQKTPPEVKKLKHEIEKIVKTTTISQVKKEKKIQKLQKKLEKVARQVEPEPIPEEPEDVEPEDPEEPEPVNNIVVHHSLRVHEPPPEAPEPDVKQMGKAVHANLDVFYDRRYDDNLHHHLVQHVDNSSPKPSIVESTRQQRQEELKRALEKAQDEARRHASEAAKRRAARKKKRHERYKSRARAKYEAAKRKAARRKARMKAEARRKWLAAKKKRAMLKREAEMKRAARQKRREFRRNERKVKRKMKKQLKKMDKKAKKKVEKLEKKLKKEVRLVESGKLQTKRQAKDAARAIKTLQKRVKYAARKVKLDKKRVRKKVKRVIASAKSKLNKVERKVLKRAVKAKRLKKLIKKEKKEVKKEEKAAKKKMKKLKKKAKKAMKKEKKLLKKQEKKERKIMKKKAVKQQKLLERKAKEVERLAVEKAERHYKRKVGLDRILVKRKDKLKRKLYRILKGRESQRRTIVKLKSGRKNARKIRKLEKKLKKEDKEMKKKVKKIKKAIKKKLKKKMKKASKEILKAKVKAKKASKDAKRAIRKEKKAEEEGENAKKTAQRAMREAQRKKTQVIVKKGRSRRRRYGAPSSVLEKLFRNARQSIDVLYKAHRDRTPKDKKLNKMIKKLVRTDSKGAKELKKLEKIVKDDIKKPKRSGTKKELKKLEKLVKKSGNDDATKAELKQLEKLVRAGKNVKDIGAMKELKKLERLVKYGKQDDGDFERAELMKLEHLVKNQKKALSVRKLKKVMKQVVKSKYSSKSMKKEMKKMEKLVKKQKKKGPSSKKMKKELKKLEKLVKKKKSSSTAKMATMFNKIVRKIPSKTMVKQMVTKGSPSSSDMKKMVKRLVKKTVVSGRKMKRYVKKLVKRKVKQAPSTRKLKQVVKKLVAQKAPSSGRLKRMVKHLVKKSNKSQKTAEKKMLKIVAKAERKAKHAIKKAETNASSNTELLGLLHEDHTIESLYRQAKESIDALYGRMKAGPVQMKIPKIRKSRYGGKEKKQLKKLEKLIKKKKNKQQKKNNKQLKKLEKLIKKKKKKKLPCGYKKQKDLRDRLKNGWMLRPGQFLRSKNRKCTLHMETKGNMVVYKGKDVVWSTNTAGKKGAHLQLKKGKLTVVYKKRPIWDATYKQKAYNLIITNSCYLELFNKRGKPVWSTDPKFKPSKKSLREKDRSGGICKFGEPVFLESQRDKRLIDQKGKIRMHDTRKTAAYWQILEGDKKNSVFIRGHRGEHLQDADTGVMASKLQLGRETWRLRKLGNKWMLKSSTGKNLQDDGGVVRMQNSKKHWDRWTIRSVKGRMKCTQFKGYAREKDRIRPGSILKPGQFIKSKSNQCAMHMQKDGNLVIFKGRRASWTSNTVGKAGSYLKVRKDGNVVIEYRGKPIWAADTKGHKVRALVLKNDCNMMLYSRSNEGVWASNRKLLVHKKRSHSKSKKKKAKDKGPGGKYSNAAGKITGGSGTCKFGERVYLKSHRNHVLEDDGGKISMHRTPRRQSQWQILNAGDGRVFIAGHRGQYLQDAGKRKVTVARTQLGPETWSLTKIGKGKYVIMGRSKRNLVDDGGLVRLRQNKNEFGRWTIVSEKHGKKCESFKGQAREPDRLRPGEQLGSGDWIKSRNSKCALHMQSDGNLALYTGPYVTWASNTGGSAGAVFKVHEGGKVDISKGSKVVWNAETKGHKVRDVMLQNNCNLAMYDRRNQRVWAIHNPPQPVRTRKGDNPFGKKTKKKKFPSQKPSRKEMKQLKEKVQRAQMKRETKRIMKRQERRMKRKAKRAKKKKDKIKKKIDRLMREKSKLMGGKKSKGELQKKLKKIAKKAKKTVKKIKKKLKKKVKKLLKKKPSPSVQDEIRRNIRKANKKEKKLMKKEAKSLKKAIKKDIDKKMASANKPGKCGFGEPVYIVSLTGKSLQEGGSTCSVGSSLETWQILDASNDKVFIAKSKGKHLSYFKGKIKVSRNQLEWERWSLDPTSKPGIYTISGKTGKSLTDEVSKVGLSMKGSKWMIKRKDGKICSRFKGDRGQAYQKKLKKQKKKIKKKLKKLKKKLKKTFNKVTKGKLDTRSPNKMRPGTRVNGGEYIESPNKKCALHMQHDGNLVLYQGETVKWASNTYGKKGAYLRMQKDGKVVVFYKGSAAWSASNGMPGQVLTLNDDCNLVLYSKTGKSIWSTARDKQKQVFWNLSSKAAMTKDRLNSYARNSRQRQRQRRHARRAKAVLRELKKRALNAATGGNTSPTSGAKANRKAEKAMEKAKKLENRATEAEAKAETTGKKKDIKKAVKAKVKAKKEFQKAERRAQKAAAINGRRRRLIDYDALFHSLVEDGDNLDEESISSEDDSIDITDPDAASETDEAYLEEVDLGSRLLEFAAEF